MPIYDYQCQGCQHEFHVFYTTFSAVEREEASEPCPKCDSLNKHRLISQSTSFQLKGGGWAKDRYGAGGFGRKGGSSSGEGGS